MLILRILLFPLHLTQCLRNSNFSNCGQTNLHVGVHKIKWHSPNPLCVFSSQLKNLLPLPCFSTCLEGDSGHVTFIDYAAPLSLPFSAPCHFGGTLHRGPSFFFPTQPGYLEHLIALGVVDCFGWTFVSLAEIRMEDGMKWVSLL